MTAANAFKLDIIGDRINPGFKSTKALLDNEDIAGIQALAVKQAEAGATSLDFTIGPRALTDKAFMAEVVRAVQAAVTLPLCFDSPDLDVQEACLSTYDRGCANGRLPIVNSITEHRWDLMTLARRFRFKVIVMLSERVENGEAMRNRAAGEIHATAKRTAQRLAREHGLAMSDIYVDVSVCAVVADTEGLHRGSLDAISLIRTDPDLAGIRIMGGLTNIGQQLPAKAADGSDLKQKLENAFLTMAVPRGFDTVLGTPWRGYQALPDDDYVLSAYRHFLDQRGSNSLRAVRKLYRG